MVMKTGFTYMADAAVFKGAPPASRSQWITTSRANKVTLQSNQNASEPVFLTFNAHFSVRKSMEEGQIEGGGAGR